MLYIGALVIHFDGCKGQHLIPIWLAVFGSFRIFQNLVNIFKYSYIVHGMAIKVYQEGECTKVGRGWNCCETILSLFYFIWIIAGSAWVFGYFYFRWSPSDCTNNYDIMTCGCNHLVFTFSYVILIVMYAVNLLIYSVRGCFGVWFVYTAKAASRGND